MFGVVMLAAMVAFALAISVPCGLIVRKAGYSPTVSVLASLLALLANLAPLIIVGLLPSTMLRSIGGFVGLIPTVIIVGGLWWFALVKWPALRVIAKS